MTGHLDVSWRCTTVRLHRARRGWGEGGGVADAGIRVRGGVRTASSRPRTAVSIFDAETRASRERLSVRDGKLRGDGTKASAR